MDSKQLIGEKYQLSSRTISRYLRINELIPELKERLDNDEFAIRVGDALSFLKYEEQGMVDAVLASGMSISIKQADLLKEQSQEGRLSSYIIKEVLEPGYFGKKVKPIKFSGKFLSQYFTFDQSAYEIECIVAEALEQYFAKKQ